MGRLDSTGGIVPNPGGVWGYDSLDPKTEQELLDEVTTGSGDVLNMKSGVVNHLIAAGGNWFAIPLTTADTFNDPGSTFVAQDGDFAFPVPPGKYLCTMQISCGVGEQSKEAGIAIGTWNLIDFTILSKVWAPGGDPRMVATQMMPCSAADRIYFGVYNPDLGTTLTVREITVYIRKL